MNIIKNNILFICSIFFIVFAVPQMGQAKTVYIVTDNTWMTYGKFVSGWEMSEFDDSSWWEAKAVDSPGNVMNMEDTSAQWIWYLDGAEKVDRFFRKTFTIDKQIISGLLKITADDQYYIYINGNLVGQDTATESWSSSEVYDVGEYIKPGKNVIAVKAKDIDQKEGLLAELAIKTSSLNSQITERKEATITPKLATPVPSVSSETSSPSISISKQIVDFNKNGQFEEGEKLVITYGANDDSGVKSIKVSLDGNLIELRNNEGTYSITTDSLSMGDHSIVVEATDSKGNKKSEEMKINVARAGPSVYFPISRYEVNEGEEVNLVLSAVNPIGNPKMEAQLILKPPSNGVSILEGDCRGLAGMCTSSYSIESGDSVRPISVRMRADKVGEYPIDSEVYYQFDGGQRSPTRHETLTLVVKPKPQTPNPTSTQAPSTPGFEFLSGIFGFLIIVLMRDINTIRRRKIDE